MKMEMPEEEAYKFISDKLSECALDIQNKAKRVYLLSVNVKTSVTLDEAVDELDAAVDNYIGLKEKMFKEVEENA